VAGHPRKGFHILGCSESNGLLRNGEIALSPPLLELLLRSVDVLRALLDAAIRGEAREEIFTLGLDPLIVLRDLAE